MKKSEQTYEWALAAMQTPARDRKELYSHVRWYNKPTDELLLSDIHETHHTEELMLAAVRNGHAHLNQVPASIVKQLTQDEILRSLQHLHFRDFRPVILLKLPDEVNTFSLRKAIVSTMPDMFNNVFYAQREGRESEPYSKEDVELVLEAICPSVYAKNRINELKRKPKLKTQEERDAYAIQESSLYFSARQRLPRQLLFEALKLYEKQLTHEKQQEPITREGEKGTSLNDKIKNARERIPNTASDPGRVPER